MSFVKDIKRSHSCGELSASHSGQEVVLMGWVDVRRDHGGLIFVDLRDRYGITQIVLDPAKDGLSEAKSLRNEFVIALKGKVNLRPEGMANKNLSTGEIEVDVQELKVLSVAEVPPIQVNDDKVSEVTRLKYRYLDLRSRKLQSNFVIRHRLNQIIRKELSALNFLEVETPILYKSTPEGARDYLVPSRVHPGSFYALPQSPQTLKQLLMVSGFDKYFQIARCFRDEDLRADRQPEFTQLDLEMSFIDMDDVMSLNENIMRTVWKEIRGKEIAEFPVLSYEEAMNNYGNDKPDLRFGLKLNDLSEVLLNSGFKVFDDAIAREDGAVKGICVEGAASEFSRAKIDKLTKMAQKSGAKGLVWIKWEADKISSAVSKFFDDEKLKSIVSAMGGKEGDMALIVADTWSTTCSVLASLRLHLGKELNLIDTTVDKFCWVIDFPLLEFSPEDSRWYAVHHPFTMVKDEYIDDLVSGNSEKFANMKAKAYDLVCNGYEIGGGSIRIHNPKVQDAMFKALGVSEEEQQERFGFFVDALKYGTPPHGGIAWGLDRVSMILCNTENIRDIIAFPKTTKASDLMSEAPSIVDREQLLELGIRLSESAEKRIQEGEHKNL